MEFRITIKQIINYNTLFKVARYALITTRENEVPMDVKLKNRQWYYMYKWYRKEIEKLHVRLVTEGGYGLAYSGKIR